MENLKKESVEPATQRGGFRPRIQRREKEPCRHARERQLLEGDGLRRLRKNKIAMVSLVVILLIAFMAYVLPSCGPTAMSCKSRAATTWPRLSILPPSRSSSTPAKRSSPTSWAPTVWAVTLPCVS